MEDGWSRAHSKKNNNELRPEVRQSCLAYKNNLTKREIKIKTKTKTLKFNAKENKKQNKRKITKNKKNNKKEKIRIIKRGKSLKPKVRPARKMTIKAEVLLGRKGSRKCT